MYLRSNHIFKDGALLKILFLVLNRVFKISTGNILYRNISLIPHYRAKTRNTTLYREFSVLLKISLATVYLIVIQTRWNEENAYENQSSDRHCNREGNWSTESEKTEQKDQMSRNFDETSKEEVEVIAATV